MSGFAHNLQQRREHLEEIREDRLEHRGRGHGRDDGDFGHHGRSLHHGGGRFDNYDNYDDNDDDRRFQSYASQGQGQGPRGYEPPPGVPPSMGRGGPRSGFTSQGGFDRGDFASDEEIARMVSSGEFEGKQPQGYGGGRDRYDTPAGPPPAREYGGRYDTPSGPPPGQGYGERASEYGRPPPRQEYGERASERGRYDTPSGPPPGQGYGERANAYNQYDTPSGHPPNKSEQYQAYGEGPDRQNQYGSQQPHAQGHLSGYGRKQGNAPVGGFTASNDGEDQYGSNEPPRRGEATSYYNQSGQGDRYAHLAGIAQEHGDDDPEAYRRATQGLHEKIQAQTQSRPSGEGGDYKAHVEAHRKAYEEDDHGPMDADTIGAAAAMEAFKQTAAGGKAGKTQGGPSSKSGRATQEEEEEEEEDTTAARGSGGLQDKLMTLAMSHAGKLFDKKNAGSNASSGDKAQNKAQAMQSAAASAMQLFSQYKSKGSLEPGDMQKVMGLAMNFL